MKSRDRLALARSEVVRTRPYVLPPRRPRIVLRALSGRLRAR